MRIVYLKNFRRGLATNSSSTHSLIYRNEGEVFEDLDVLDVNYYDRFTRTIAASKQAKIKYVLAAIMYDEALVRIISYHGNISKPINVTSDSIDLRQIRPRLGAARHLININEKVMPDYVLSNRREIPEIEKKLYHEVSSIQTLGGEVIMRILVPNENRDSYCKSHAQECRISVW